MLYFKYIVLFCILTMLMAGCSQESAPGGTEIAKPSEENSIDTSVWVVYWDLSNASTSIAAMSDNISGISLFAGYFDSEGGLFVPKELSAFSEQIRAEYSDKNWDYYLTFVNDVQFPDYSLPKDTEILSKLFEDNVSMQVHIDEIIDLAHQYNVDGIEIDYEAIKSDMELWDKFIVFCERLYSRTSEEGLKMRVILEPKAPVEELTFPKGPEYVMMCYNLYGFDESPGPKANYEFLSDLLDKTKSLPGTKSFALANGGFDWIEGSAPTEVTEAEAKDLALKHRAVVYRSKNSAALTFQYRDEKNREHTVWYSDSDTIDSWKDIVSESGLNNVMLWRIE